MNKNLYFGERVYFAKGKTNWRQKTLAVGIGRYAVECKDFEYRYYLCIGINLILWYVTAGVKLPEGLGVSE